jgi:hypothetical protein
MEQPYFYANQGYNFNRLPRKTITIKLDTTVTSKVYSLHEPITIDQHSDIFIDSFITNNMAVTSGDTDIFILDIKDFNIQSVSNEPKYNNKILIPNTVGAGTPADTLTVAHRATKFNFVSSINPTRLTSLEISLTNNASTPAALSGTAYITFMIVARDK